ncbi:MAG TPA: phosphopyruvate hydratase [Acetobacteraceae bacterium]|nr:phosphopyruvate hydratase [Acetobacteraceae bacterium]
MSNRIQSITAMEILDSRGNPTLRIWVTLGSGITGAASVPSGASTGRFEAHELRDGDKSRYGGKGVLVAAQNVIDVIGPKLHGMNVSEQADIDRVMIELDGTPNKSRLGANAIVGVSMAVARTAALATGRPLYESLGGPGARRMPVPMMNVINGGTHADNSLDFQEYMIVPHGAASFAEALRYGAETFQALKALLKARGFRTAVGDEGGFAPDLDSNEAACALIVEAIRTAGFRPGPDVAIALDPAASAFATSDGYELRRTGGGLKTSAEMTALYARWLAAYPIISLEDGLGDDDWAGFQEHTAMLGKRVQIVGDDIFVTNTQFIGRGIKEQSANAALIKLNQIGTVTETIGAIQMCRDAGWNFVISHRSGETEDPFIADFTVAMGGGQIKTGSLCRSERIAKYNRLLEIERELGANAIFASPFPTSPVA